MISRTEQSDQAPNRVNNRVEPVTRHTGFSLNQSKQVKNLVNDATISDYDILINNFDENVNIKCSSGFFIRVGSPAILDLARQTCENKSLNICNIKIRCSNSRISLDENNLHVNSTYFFDLTDFTNDALVGKVTVHCHVTTKVIQLQGSKLISGSKAPVWFFKNVLQNTLQRESSEKRVSISKTNDDISKLLSEELTCELCDKKYKTPGGLQKHLQSKHESVKHSSPQPSQSVPSILRKRKSSIVDVDCGPPEKTLALENSVSVPRITTTPAPVPLSVAPPSTSPQSSSFPVVPMPPPRTSTVPSSLTLTIPTSS